MLPLIRILLLWVALLFTSHSVLAHYLLGSVSARTLRAGIEPNALRFYGFLAAFGIAAYYFCREVEEWRKPMPLKVSVSAILAIGLLAALSGLERLDGRMYAEMKAYQLGLIAGRFGSGPEDLPEAFVEALSEGAPREAAGFAYPNSLPMDWTVRHDGTAYENFLYWVGPMGDPVGAQVSYTAAPHRVERVNPLPLPKRPQPETADVLESTAPMEQSEEDEKPDRSP